LVNFETEAQSAVVLEVGRLACVLINILSHCGLNMKKGAISS
jgi:hypothetical protein